MDVIRIVGHAVNDRLIGGRRIAGGRDGRAEEKVESVSLGSIGLKCVQKLETRRIQAQQERRLVVIRITGNSKNRRAVGGVRRTRRREIRAIDRVEAAAKRAVGLKSAIKASSLRED